MANQNGKNFVESVLDAQKKMVDSMVENTKKVTNGNSFINEAIDKGTETYKNWMEQQKNAMSGVNQKAETVQETAKENINKINEFSQNWLNNQINWVKQAWEMNQNFIKTHTPNEDTFKAASNPMEMFNTMSNNWNKMSSWMNQANEAGNYANQWMKMMQQFSPVNASENFKKTTDNYTGLFNQYFELLNNSFSEMQKNMHHSTSKDVYGNMMNAASSFGKFNEIWAPFWKSIQENNFNADLFKKTFNAGVYKEMLDKFFGLMPENSRQYMQQATEWMNGGMKGFADFGKGGFAQGREFMNNMNPFAGQNVFENALNSYQQMQSTFQNAVAPIAKMVTPNQFSKSATEWSDIVDRMAIFNIKNAELQYMMYQQGNKVMDKLVENITNKVENGTEINSMTALYQEWLNISDKVFVELFESDDYSKLMAEVSALQLKLRKEMDLQAEKMLGGLPVATRSEMDELYKVIYDLKKEVRQLEKMLDIDSNEPITEVTEAATAKKAATKKA
jgi:polyhydroxyalkanoate synthesis regulator phasin